jgi:O-antigen ligase
VSASKSGRQRLLFGGTVLLAIILGAAIAYAARFVGDSGPYILVGASLSAVIAVAILSDWRFGVLLLLVALPFQAVINVGSLVSGTKALALLTFFSFGVALLRERELSERFLRLWRQPLTLAVCAFALWASLSVLWAADLKAALASTSTVLGVFSLMILVGMLKQRYLVLCWALMTLSAALTVPAAYILGIGAKMVVGRLSIGQDANSLASLLVIVFFVAYFGLRQYSAAVYVLAPIFFYGIFATQSRAGLLALVIPPLLAVFVPGLAARVGGHTLLMFGIGIAALIGMTLAFPTVGEAVLERYTTISQYQDENTWSGRWSIWQGALQVIATHPILGVGVGNFASAAVAYSEMIFEVSNEGGAITGVAHNMLLSVASELGLIGLILFLGVLLFAFKAALSVSQRSTLGMGVLLGLMAYTITGMSLTWEYENLGYILLGSLLALKLQETWHAQRSENPETAVGNG